MVCTRRAGPSHRQWRYLCVYLLLAAPWMPLIGLQAAANKCSRMPEGHGAKNAPADGRFHVRILENAVRYTPGDTYTISLEGIDAGVRRQQTKTMRHKFSGFILAVESKTVRDAGLLESPTAYGTFSLRQGNSLTKITCANMVTHTTTTPKSEVQVLWTAPEAGAGCVAFRATVIEHRDVWYMDDGPLTKEFCEDEQTIDDTLSGTLSECCACAEAKYELTFEGLWSRNTHPKDFPSNNWLTRFSDIIGATHTGDYRFWQYGGQASAGLKQVAEHGATKELESELKGESDNIRTIIKARGLAFPNVTGKTFAVFRVDRLHHLMSFVSMIDPSPDWFLGVSGLELCMANCSWVESKVIDLYPWDAGTDSGPTYISPDLPTTPADNIRRIRADHPNDPRSPFYDPDTATMKPLARLYLLRQRLYEKNCPDEQENGGGNDSGGGGGGGGAEPAVKPCATTPWGRYSACNSDCGSGQRTRQRNYVNEEAALQANCRKELTHSEDCVGKQPHCDAAAEAGGGGEEEVEQVTERQCALTEWSDWSVCEPKCGHGMQNRRRRYKEKKAKKRCEGGDYHPELFQEQACETTDCVGDVAPSGEEQQLIRNYRPNQSENDDRSKDKDDLDNNEDFENTNRNGETNIDESSVDNCVGNWSEWTPCSLTCGGGERMRYSRPRGREVCKSTEERMLCNRTPCSVPRFCYQDPQGGGCLNANPTNLYFFNRNATRCDWFTWSCGRHRNKFTTYDECITVCTGKTPRLIEEQEKVAAREQEEQEQRRNHRNHNRNHYN